MTLDIDPIHDRAKAATPGPWEVDFDEPAIFTMNEDILGGTIAWINSDQQTGGHDPEADAQFIAHAPEDVMALLVEVTQLRAELAGLWSALVEDLLKQADAEGEALADRLADCFDVDEACALGGELDDIEAARRWLRKLAPKDKP